MVVRMSFYDYFRRLSFAEQIKLLSSLAILWAGPVVTGVYVWQNWIVWRGGWHVSLQAQQLRILGNNSYFTGVILLCVLTAWALGASLSMIKWEFGKFKAEMRDDAERENNEHGRS